MTTARIFSTDQHRAAAAAIAEARNDGVALYLAAFPEVTGETIEQRAERLKAAWCGREIGLVVVVDASTNRCTFLSHLSENEWLSSDRLRAIFQDATTASISKKTAGERLLSVVQHLAAQIHSALASRPSAASNTSTFRAWIVFGAVLGACALLGLGVLVAFRPGRRVSSNRLEPAFFPTVAVEPRFGGGFAGGVAAEVQFRGEK